MSLSTDEKTIHDGAPREIYRFKIDGATDRNYTSYYTDITFSAEGRTYTAVPGLRRGPIKVNPTGDSPDLEITMPSDLALITDLLKMIPPRRVLLTIKRAHGTFLKSNSRIIWRGHITGGGLSQDGYEATLVSQSVMSAMLQTSLPSVAYQALCNNVLYDGMCGVDRTSYDTSTTVLSYTDNVVTCAASPSLGADQLHKGGVVVRDTDGERRTIVDQTGQVLTLMRPFRQLAASDAITVYQGCDHLAATCSSKFSNISNFNGFPDTKAANPFTGGWWGHGGIFGGGG